MSDEKAGVRPSLTINKMVGFRRQISEDQPAWVTGTAELEWSESAEGPPSNLRFDLFSDGRARMRVKTPKGELECEVPVKLFRVVSGIPAMGLEEPSARPASCSAVPAPAGSRLPDRESKYRDDRGVSQNLGTRLDRIHAAFERCTLLGMQAPSLAELHLIASGSSCPPYTVP